MKSILLFVLIFIGYNVLFGILGSLPLLNTITVPGWISLACYIILTLITLRSIHVK